MASGESLSLQELVIHRDHYDHSVLLNDWGAAIGSSFTAILPTALGHLFLERTDASIWLLDTWTGQTHGVSETYEDFKQAVGTDGEFVRSWFMADLVAALLEAQLQRSSGECFSPFVSPGLGGSLTPGNFAPCSLRVHLATTAAEHKAVRGSAHA